MALVVGTNCGLVTVAPTTDPAGSLTTLTNFCDATKITTPSGHTKITEIGFYIDTGGSSGTASVGLYSHDSGSDKPNALLYSDSTGLSGVKWYNVVVDWDVTENTIYWLAVNTTKSSTYTNYGNTAVGTRRSSASGTSLPATWAAGSTETADSCYAIYGISEVGVEYVDIESTINLTIGLSGTLAVTTYVDLESTIDFTIGVSGTLAVTSTIDLEATVPISIGVSGTLTVGTDWKTQNTVTIMRLVAIGNDSLWYEEIS